MENNIVNDELIQRIEEYNNNLEILEQKEDEINELFAYSISKINKIKNSDKNYLSNPELYSNLADLTELNEEYKNVYGEKIKTSLENIKYLKDNKIKNKELIETLTENKKEASKSLYNKDQEVLRATDFGLIDKDLVGFRRDSVLLKTLAKNCIKGDFKDLIKNIVAYGKSDNKSMNRSVKYIINGERTKKHTSIEFLIRPAENVVDRVRAKMESEQNNQYGYNL